MRASTTTALEALNIGSCKLCLHVFCECEIVMSVIFCVAAYLRRTRRRHARCLRNCIPKTTSNASPATWKSGCDASFFFILFVPRKFVRFLIFRLFDFRHRSFVVFPQLDLRKYPLSHHQGMPMGLRIYVSRGAVHGCE